MFCTKCGKELYEGDRFCAHCGAEVREPKRARYDDVVFNPPFKIEAEKRTEEILKAAEKPQPQHKSRETVDFDWNLEGFPAAQPRKTEAVDFNWDSVVEKRNNSRRINVEKIDPDEGKKIESDVSTDVIPEVSLLERELEEKEEEALSIEELEKELFGSMDDKDDKAGQVSEPTIIAAASSRKEQERFYTYNQKFDAFQELLEKEKEKLKKMEESYNKDKEHLDYTWAGDVFPDMKRADVKEAAKQTTAEEPAMTELMKEPSQPHPENIAETPRPAEMQKTPQPSEVQVVGVAVPPVTIAVDAIGEESEQRKEPFPSEGDEGTKVPKETGETTATGETKEKLRYSDVFPRSLVNDAGTGPADDAEAEQKETLADGGTLSQDEKKSQRKALDSIYDDLDEDDEPKKKHVLAKIIIAILIILIVLEGVVIITKFVAPESRLSLWANDMMLNVVDLFTGGSGESDGDVDNEPAVGDEKDAYLSNLVKEAAADAETIGETFFSPELKYSMLTNYSFEEIPETESFVDADWLEDAEGNPVTYGQKLMEALVRYYDGWQSTNNDKSLVGINKLEIGEIRTGREGFYALCKITYAGEDGNDIVKYQTVYLRISGDAMIINVIKEDKL